MSRLDALRKLIALDPADPLPHYSVGIEHIQLAQWDEAAAAFDRAITLNPLYSVAYYHKARAQIGGGKHDDARATLAAGLDAAQRAGDWHARNEMTELLETLP